MSVNNKNTWGGEECSVDAQRVKNSWLHKYIMCVYIFIYTIYYITYTHICNPLLMWIFLISIVIWQYIAKQPKSGTEGCFITNRRLKSWFVLIRRNVYIYEDYKCTAMPRCYWSSTTNHWNVYYCPILGPSFSVVRTFFSFHYELYAWLAFWGLLPCMCVILLVVIGKELLGIVWYG